MAFESLTDEKIAELLSCPKLLNNPQARIKNKDGHEQVNYKVSEIGGFGHEFEVYKRQNLRDGMEDDFSCGISWIAPNGETLTLKRYNGPNHDHLNNIEKTRLGNASHIHKATEKYIKANKKAEGYAEVTSRFATLKGALHCLLNDCNITGLSTTPDNPSQQKLFD